MTHVAQIAEVLGIARPGVHIGALQIVDAVSRGLPIAALDSVARLIGGDPGFKFRIVPKASLARRKAANLLSSQESDRVARIARIWVFAREVWGDDDAVRDFMSRAHPLLEDRRPIDLVVENEMGAEMVRDVLGRLQYGSAA